LLFKKVNRTAVTLNRILAPTLRISQRPRWRTPFIVKDIDSLINPKRRAKRKKELMKKHSGQAKKKHKEDNQKTLPL